MLLDSFIISSFIKLFHWLSRKYEESLLSSLCGKLVQWINKLGSNSYFIHLITRAWPTEKYVKNSKLVGKIASREQHCIEMPKTIKESFFFNLLSYKIEFYVLCLIIFAIPFFPTMVLVGLVLLDLLIILVKGVVGIGEGYRWERIDFPICIFLICLLVSTLTAFGFKEALEIFLVYIVLILSYKIVTTVITDKKHLNILLMVLLASGLLVALYGVYQYFVGVPMDSAWIDESSFDITTRVYSTFGNPNVLGEYLIVVTMISIGMLWYSDKAIGKITFLGISCIMALCLLFTASRGSWIGLVIGLAVFALFVEQKLIGVGIIGLLMLPSILPPQYLERIMSITNLKETSSAYRVSILQATLDMIKVYWPSGIGLGSFDKVYPLFSYEAAFAYHSHNTFLQILLELGIVGFIAFIFVLIVYLQKNLSAYAITKSKRWKAIMVAIVGGSLGFWAQGMVDHIWFNYKIFLFFWVIIGLGVVTSKIALKSGESID